MYTLTQIYHKLHTHTCCVCIHTFTRQLGEQFSVYTYSDSLVHTQPPSQHFNFPKISRALSGFHSQPAPACLYHTVRLAVSWEDRSMKQPLAPASIVGTAKAFSGEITEALVKSHRHLVGHFPFPFKGGGRGTRRWRQKTIKGHRPTGGMAELCHVTRCLPLAEF